MDTLSEQQIVEKISNRETFQANIEGNGFNLKLNHYEPALCAAIHNGGTMIRISRKLPVRPIRTLL